MSWRVEVLPVPARALIIRLLDVEVRASRMVVCSVVGSISPSRACVTLEVRLDIL